MPTVPGDYLGVHRVGHSTGYADEASLLRARQVCPYSWRYGSANLSMRGRMDAGIYQPNPKIVLSDSNLL